MAYTPTTWNTGDVITAEKLNKIETGIQNATLPGKAAALEVLAEPTTADAPTIATKVNEIIAQLKARGIVS